MDSDNNKNENISSPKGPEDASNIADEYPSPEREPPQTLHDHTLADQTPTQAQQRHGHDGQDEHANEHPVQHQHEDTDMQTELARQVAAQAIEAVAAAARASSQAPMNTPSQGGHAINGTSQHGPSVPPPQSAGIDIAPSQHPAGEQEHRPGSVHAQSSQALPQQLRAPGPQHHPRQPTFPRTRAPLSTYPVRPSGHSHHPHPSAGEQLSSGEQIQILREAYARNPNPSKKELEALAEKTGRPWNKIREYFRQRRNKLRGLEDLEAMEEPGRASGWLQVAYRAASPTTHVSQLSLYNSYRHRFDPYSITTPLLGGQELIQLACATFPGCEMARNEDEYVLKGLKEREKEKEGGKNGQNDGGEAGNGNGHDQEEWEKGMEGLVEPLRAGSWLLSSFQHQNDPNAPSTLTQTDLYTSYAARFSSLLTNAAAHESDQSPDASEAEVRAVQDHAAEIKAFEDAGLGETAGEAELVEEESEHGPEGGMEVDEHQSLAQLSFSLPEANASSSVTPPPPQPHGPASTSTAAQVRKVNRLLNPLELINLTRMTFPKCEPSVDQEGRFVIRGLERREGTEPGSKGREREMFPFALHGETRPGEAFVSLMKRKLGMLNPESDPNSSELGRASEEPLTGTRAGLELNDDGVRVKRPRLEDDHGEEGTLGEEVYELTEGDNELIDGLKRFRGSKLGEKVREVCVTQ